MTVTIARRAARRLLLPLLVLLCGCSFFSKSQSRFYTLDVVPPAGAAAALRGTPVGIDTLELPPGVDRKEVVVRAPDHQLTIRSAEQWEASFQPLVLHTLAFDLARRLPDGMVVLPGDAKPLQMRTIDVAFEELAAGPEGAVRLDARWTLGGVTHHEQIRVDVRSLDSAQIAAGISTALATLAERMAADLARP